MGLPSPICRSSVCPQRMGTDFIQLFLEFAKDLDYWRIFILMAIESSFFPVPSEVVVIPAAIASTQGTINFWGVIASAAIGTWAGSALTYVLALRIGRPLIMRWGKYIMMPAEKLERAEIFLARYEKGAIFFSRLLPVVRHLISIPAGLVRMNFLAFSTITFIGSFLWCWVLAWYGQRMGMNNPNMLDNVSEFVAAARHEILEITLLSFVIALLYFLMLRLTDPSRRRHARRAPVAQGQQSNDSKE